MNKPSVTTLIQMLDKPAIVKWANQLGLDGVGLDEYRVKKFSEGRKIHKQVETWLTGAPIDDEQIEAKCKRFFADKNVVAVEKNIETEWFVGRLDLAFSHNGKLWLCDLKTNKTRVRFENILQLAAYKMAMPCDELALISVPKFRLMPVESDTKPYEEILKHLSAIYTLKTQCK